MLGLHTQSKRQERHADRYRRQQKRQHERTPISIRVDDRQFVGPGIIRTQAIDDPTDRGRCIRRPVFLYAVFKWSDAKLDAGAIVVAEQVPKYLPDNSDGPARLPLIIKL